MKYMLCFLFSVHGYYYCNAQFKIGPQAAIGFTSPSLITRANNFVGTGSNYNTIKGRLGYSVGAVAVNRVSNTLSGKYNLLFNRSSWKNTFWIDASNPIAFGAAVTDFTYLSFSALLNYSSALGSGRVFVGVGAGLHYLLQGKVKGVSDYADPTTEKMIFKVKQASGVYVDVVNQVQPVFVANFGYTFPNNIQLCVQYQVTLKEYYRQTTLFDNTKTHTVSLHAAYMFELKKKRHADH